MDLTRFQELITDLESHPDRVQLHHLELEKFITWSMDEVYRLSKSGENNNIKMQITALEYRARLLIERCRKAGVN